MQGFSTAYIMLCTGVAAPSWRPSHARFSAAVLSARRQEAKPRLPALELRRRAGVLGLTYRAF